MTCEQAMALLSAKLDNELSQSEDLQLQAHLDGCPDCRALLEAMTSIEDRVQDLEEPVPEHFRSGVMYRIQTESGGGKKRRRFLGVGTGMGLVAAALVLLVGTGVIHLPKYRPKSAAAPTESVKSTDVLIEAPASRPPLQNGVTVSEMEAEPETEMFQLPAETVKGGLSGTVGNILDGSLFVNNPGLDDSQFEFELPGNTGTAFEGSHPLHFPGTEGPQQYAGETDSPMPEAPAGTEEPEEPCMPAATETEAPQYGEPWDVWAVCADLCAREQAPVLVYTDFSADSLTGLLEAEAPALYEILTFRPPEPLSELSSDVPADLEYAVYTLTWDQALALQEWLTLNAPHTPQGGASAARERLEALDPNSESLYRVISWEPRLQPVDWPVGWGEAWAERFLEGDSWDLFFPAEDFSPGRTDLTLLVLPAAEE